MTQSIVLPKSLPQRSRLIVSLILISQLTTCNCLNRTNQQVVTSKKREVSPLADEMFVDLRQTDCLSKVRNQGECGSCYAFAGITMAEWAYCKQMGRLRAFSEQYVLDCGHLVGMEGVCQGAWPEELIKFFHTLGFELRDQYLAYAAKATNCAHNIESGHDFSEAGLVRTKIDQLDPVPIEKWHETLASGTPLLVNINLPIDFSSYSYGVDRGHSCGFRGSHLMVVVGHGRKDGEEFWLVRNSHGTDWGEQGYWKLAKSAPKNCVLNQRGYTYGLKKRREFSINLSRIIWRHG